MKNSKVWLLMIVLVYSMLSCTSTNNETPKAKGIDVSLMDTSVKPGDDFYRYVNGKWMDKTEIPSDESRWGSFNELRDNTNKDLLALLQSKETTSKFQTGSDEAKVIDFYQIGMDSMLAENQSYKPIQPLLDKIESIADKKDMEKTIGDLHIVSTDIFFGFSVFPDLKKSTINSAYIFQGGLGLPDREYYLKKDEKSKNIQNKYVAHVSKMLQKIGYDAKKADDAAKNIMELETKLATSSMAKEETRNTPLLYNKRSVSDLKKMVPSFDWDSYLNQIGVQKLDTLIVGMVKFTGDLEKIFTTTSLQTLKDYMKWAVVNANAGSLSNDFVKADFDFYSKELNGTAEMKPRWERVMGRTNQALGEALGKVYVSEKFPAEAKEKAKQMVDNILAAFGDRIRSLNWMTDSTKQMALKKLSTFTVKIGYPDQWKSYQELVVVKNSYAENVLNVRRFQHFDDIKKIGQPVDKKEWGMSPQTVNAYYSPLMNEIVFPAAILQPPFYNYLADEAVNYGGIGAVIGHEIGHGFDDQGSRFDADGNMKNWWSDQDRKAFEERTAKLIAQYNQYQPLDSVFVNGQFTLGENIGDLGGVTVAYDGLQKFLAASGRPEKIDGFTPEQRFFMSWATVWRNKTRDEALRTQIMTDPHSPGYYRAIGPLSNVDEFYTAFDIKEGDKMWKSPEERVKIW